MSPGDFAKAGPEGLPPPLAALWWLQQGDWDRAHRLVQDDPSKDAAWVHALIHRIEGDLGNAGYWYRKAGKPIASGPVDAETQSLIKTMLERT